MKQIALVTVIMIAALSAVKSFGAPLSIATTNGTGGVSGYIQYGTPPGTSAFGGAQWHVKNTGATGSTTRKGYIRFDTSDMNFSVWAARLELVVSLEAITSTQTINVYGITNETLDAWSTTGMTWANAPANDTGSAYAADLNEATLLGSFTVTTADVAGTTKTFSSQALIDFLNEDTNGQVTFVVGRVNNSGLNLLFAGDTHASYAPPTLTADRRSRVNITTTDGTDGASGQLDYDNGGQFGGAQWHVKNDGATSGLTRKGYIRFDTSTLDFTARNASLELVVSLEAITSTQTINVYGITNETLDAWSTIGMTWANAPANDTGSAYAADLNEAIYLGSFTVRTSDDAGTIKSFRSEALIDFLNEDANGLVTFILGRIAGNQNLLFAGDTHASYAPPTLTADSGAITVLNSDWYVSASQANPKIATLSFDAGATAEKLVVQVSGEGAGVSTITYNGAGLMLAGSGGNRNKGIYYLDNPYKGGPATLYVELGGLANGIAIGAVSITGVKTGVIATASASATSVTIDTTTTDCFIVAGYADQDNGSASAQSPLRQLYGGTIGSAKGAAGYINAVSLAEPHTYSFSGGGGVPESYAAAFIPYAPTQGSLFIVR